MWRLADHLCFVTGSGATKPAGMCPERNGGKGVLQPGDQPSCGAEDWGCVGLAGHRGEGDVGAFKQKKGPGFANSKSRLGKLLCQLASSRVVWLQRTYTFKYGFWLQADPSHGWNFPTSTAGAAFLCRGLSSRAKCCPKHLMSQIVGWLSTASLVCREKVRSKIIMGSLDLLQMYFQCLRPLLHPDFGACAVAVDSNASTVILGFGIHVFTTRPPALGCPCWLIAVIECFGWKGQTSLPWSETPSTRPSCSKPHLTWS